MGSKELGMTWQLNNNSNSFLCNLSTRHMSWREPTLISAPSLKLFSPSSGSFVTFLFEWSVSFWTYTNRGNCSGQSWEPCQLILQSHFPPFLSSGLDHISQLPLHGGNHAPRPGPLGLGALLGHVLNNGYALLWPCPL